MPSKKKKYNARFPAGRIKKIMQTDEEVGKVAQAVPVIISRTLELFVHSLLTKTMQITSAKNAKTLSPSHMKQCILSESRFDFLKDLVKELPDVSGLEDDVPTPPLTPAPMVVNSAPGVANLPPIVHSDGRGSRETTSLSRRTSRTGRSSKDSGETCAGSDDMTKIFMPSMATTTTTTTTSMMSMEQPQLSLPPSHQQQQQHVPNFQISMPSSFQVSQPNFYTEVDPMNLASNPSGVDSINHPTSNFSHTTNIDEDYDT